MRAVAREAHQLVRQGPLAVLLVLFGLFLSSTTGAAARAEADSPFSRLAQSRVSKSIGTLRTAPRDLAAEDDDPSETPLALPPGAQEVRSVFAVRPASTPSLHQPSAATGRVPAGYRARAPPAA
jgi:uncharacterized membrane protein YdfJ with MMPL/SSD domain